MPELFAADPLLTVFEVARLLGCSVPTVYKLEQRKRLLPEPEFDRGKYARRWRRSSVLTFQPEFEKSRQFFTAQICDTAEGTIVSPRKACQLSGLSHQLIYQCVYLALERRREDLQRLASEGDLSPELKQELSSLWRIKGIKGLKTSVSRLTFLPPIRVKVLSSMEAKRSSFGLFLEDLEKLKETVRVSVENGRSIDTIRHKTIKELCQELKVRSYGDRMELQTSINCWLKLGWLLRNVFLAEIPGKGPINPAIRQGATRNGTPLPAAKTTTIIRPVTRYDIIRVRDLWENKCSITNGIKILQKYFSQRGMKTLPLADVKKHLAGNGFVDRRYHRVCWKAGLFKWRKGQTRGGAYLCRLTEKTIQPKQKAKPGTARKLLEEWFQNGSLWALDVHRKAEKAGITGSLITAKEKLGIKHSQTRERHAYWYWGEKKPPSTPSPYRNTKATREERAEQIVNGILAKGPVKASKGLKQAKEGGASRRGLEYLRREGKLIIAVVGGVTSPDRFWWRLPDQKAPTAEELLTKYPGHIKKTYTTGRRPDPAKETVFEFCYDQYIVIGLSETDVWTLAARFGGLRPKKPDYVRVFARRWTNRFDPPLPTNRKTAAKRFRNTVRACLLGG